MNKIILFVVALLFSNSSYALKSHDIHQVWDHSQLPFVLVEADVKGNADPIAKGKPDPVTRNKPDPITRGKPDPVTKQQERDITSFGWDEQREQSCYFYEDGSIAMCL